MTNGTRRWWGVGVTPWPLFTPGKDPVPIVQEPGRAPGPVWTRAENLTPPGFDPRTVQRIASRYTDYATRPQKKNESVGTRKLIQNKNMYKLLTVPVETLLEAPEPKASTGGEQHEVM